MKLTSFSRGYWEMAKACGQAKSNVLRDYDLIKDRESGKTLGQLEIKYGISRQRVCEILKENK